MGHDRSEQTEQKIKTLLVSEERCQREEGYRLLVESYKDLICHRLRRWGESKQLGIDTHSLDDIWGYVSCSVWENLVGGRFRVEGSLSGYLTTIARRKAIDHMVRKMLPTSQLEIEPITQPVDGTDQLHEDIQACFAELSPKEKCVMRIDIRLLFRDYEWPHIRVLTEHVNQACDAPLSEAAVHSLRHRGREKLRACLRRRDYEW